MKMNFLLFAFALFACIPSAEATNYYVSALIGSNANPGTFGQPFATMQTAANRTNPGDTVFVMNGTYSTSSDGVVIVRITRSGTAAQPIVYKNYQGHAPLISFNVWTAIKVTNGVGHIVIDGFKIRGNNRNILLSQALNQPGSCANTTGSPNPIYNGNGVDVNANAHHVIVRNCEVYECGGTGIGTGSADYVTIENNLVYNNCWYSKYGNSGISMNESWDYDYNTTDFKMIIRNNIVYGNRLYVPWRSGTVCQGITDGNGIILDINRNSNYEGKFLVENNVVYRNGGRGIHVYKSDNATIRNNSTFKNSASPEIAEGEITIITASNIQVYNNIMYARDGERASTLSGFTNFSANNNISYNSNQRGFYNTNDIIIDPLFIDTLNNNFRLLANSPAINTGNDSAGNFSAKDILGVSRPAGAKPDMGVYEFTGSPSLTGNFTSNNIVVLRVGDGVSSLSNNATAVNVIEYTAAGAPTGVSVLLGGAASTAPNRIVLSGNSTTAEGQLSLSSDGRYLSLAGYEGAVGNTAFTFQANEKVITRIAYNASADFSTRLPASTMNGTVRSAVTSNSDRYFITGSTVAPASDNSTRLLPFATPASTASTAFNGGVRSLKIFKGQVYCANGGTISSLTPNPSSGNYATKIDFPGMGTSGHNYQSFVLLDVNPSVGYLTTGYDVLYCTDVTLGLVKFYWNGGQWMQAGIFNPTSVTGVVGGLQDVTARINPAGNPEIFVVKSAIANNNIIAITDASGFTGSISTTLPTAVNVVSAGVNYMFRGVAFAPSQLVVLPISLLSFKAHWVDNKIVLNWATAQELNARAFIVERSDDGQNFSAIGTVAATNTATRKAYSFEDRTPLKGINFYRLKLIDQDESYKYSSIAVINGSANLSADMKVFPNPVVDHITISHSKSFEGATIRIVSVTGAIMAQYAVAKNATQTSLNTSSLRAGQYFIKFTNQGKVITTSFVK